MPELYSVSKSFDQESLYRYVYILYPYCECAELPKERRPMHDPKIPSIKALFSDRSIAPKHHINHQSRPLARLLGVAADNLDLVGRDRRVAVVHLEGHILDKKCPDLVAESVRVEAPLR